MAANDYDPYGTNDNGDSNNSNIDPNTGLPYGQAAAPTAAANSGAPNTPAPGNDANQIQGWAQEFLGRNFTDADIAGLNGQPLSAVMNGIANSPEADAYNKAHKIGDYAQLPGNPAPNAPPPYRPGGGGGGTQGPYYPGTMLQQDPRFSDLVNTLMTRAKGSLDINPLTDPIIRPQVDNYGATQTRMANKAIDQQAEAGSPYATGSLQTARTQANENAGFNTANLQSSLMTNELTARRKDITDAMQESGQLLTADQQMKLQEELGLIDANLKQQGLNSQNDQFLATFGLNQNNQNNYWDSVRSGLL